MPAPPPENDDLRRFSDVLEEIGESPDPKLKLEELVAAFGERGFGAMILILSMLALLPWPPGGKAVFAVPIILMSLELAFQRDAIWLPRWALNASISRPAYRAGVSRIMKVVRYVENLTRPRIPFLTGEIADTVTGLVCVVLALIMALPIPFGDALPGIALVFFALGMMQRDGVAILLGAAASGACGLYLFLIWRTVIEVTHHAASWMAQIFH
ncbi:MULTISPECIES: exopolysaccharide biosynthesis protein [unclassified Brevundimonas]|uniref:exopolysaccharide biosynthesis protein n=1 Tax=unclassified Brevundimonas TaxID=2622653 RepID=UPI000E9F9800|nr:MULTISPECIES: exopolysaccharide biosynthesis protein [unclassified Brevundimonas]MCK6102803.1 exopolysaccharide biosynthesis protein [Brevundimonas sp. EYE_349]HBI20448.1 exopolysaccharide biosynthesis protein exod [Brevundimonas sp.]